METRIQRLEAEPGKRLIAVSDMHARPGWMRALLDKIHFCQEDTLIFVGDIIGRGMDNIGAINLLMELVSAGNAYAVAGNWDVWQMEMLTDETGSQDEMLYKRAMQEREWHGSSLLIEMCERLMLPLNSIDDLRRARPAFLREFAPQLDFIRGLPNVIETPELIFVHGGIPSEDESEILSTSIYRLMKNDDFISRGISFKRYVVVGHWPSTLLRGHITSFSPYLSETQHIIDIDGGAGVKRAGQLNALIIPDPSAPTFEYDWYDDLPVMTALDPQAPSDDPICIRWTDCKVRVLRLEGDFAYVQHLSTGRELWTPTENLYDPEQPREGDVACVYDCTDYMIGARVGDRLSIVQRTSRGALVKTDAGHYGSVPLKDGNMLDTLGAFGWYAGRLK